MQGMGPPDSEKHDEDIGYQGVQPLKLLQNARQWGGQWKKHDFFKWPQLHFGMLKTTLLGANMNHESFIEKD